MIPFKENVKTDNHEKFPNIKKSTHVSLPHISCSTQVPTQRIISIACEEKRAPDRRHLG